jgi:hypothetical protein
MICDYDAEQQLLPLTFVVVADEQSMANWVGSCSGCVKRVVGHGKFTIISNQHLDIIAVFERPDFG